MLLAEDDLNVLAEPAAVVIPGGFSISDGLGAFGYVERVQYQMISLCSRNVGLWMD